MDGSNSGPTTTPPATVGRAAAPRSGRLSPASSMGSMSSPYRAGVRPARLLVVTGLGVCVLAIASVGVGTQLPAVLTGEQVDGRWYWVVPEGRQDRGAVASDGFRVSSKPADPRGAAVYVSMEREYVRGVFNIAVYRGYRLWWVDRGGHMRHPGVLAAIRAELARVPETRGWAPALTLRGRRVGGRDWLGTGLYGACVVVPGALMSGLLFRGGRHALGLAMRRHAAKTNRCAACRYSLQDLPIEEAQVCPECGTARTQEQEVPNHAGGRLASAA